MTMVVWMKRSRKNRLLKKMTLKMDFGCESYALLEKYININKRSTLYVEFGPCGETPPNNLTFTNKLLIK
jgi:hypothetical protein